MLVLALLLAGCESQSEMNEAPAPASASVLEVDPVLLRELLGEAVRVDGDQIRADGMLIRLAFDPLIRKTGPVSVQLVQGQGYRLSGIADGSPLWLLGLRDGDVLTGVDKQAIIGREHELRSAYESRPSRVELAYMRGSEAHTIVVRIASGSAWRSSGTDSSESSSGSRAADRLGLSRPRPSTPSSEATIDLTKAVYCEEPERCDIERQAVESLLAQPEVLMRQVRIVPTLRDGEPVGFKLYAIRPNSLPAVFGLKNGDAITNVNGHALVSLDATLATYERLRNETEFRVTLERRGQPLELAITIVDKLSSPPPTSPDLKDPFHR